MKIYNNLNISVAFVNYEMCPQVKFSNIKYQIQQAITYLWENADELDINKTPVEANLKWAISKERLSNGGFVGSEKIMNQIQGGTSQIRVGIKPEGRLIAREKTKIFKETDKQIGEITSGTFGPSVNGPIAMGYVKLNFSKPGTKVLLEVRGKKYEANISELPFYKKNYLKGEANV